MKRLFTGFALAATISAGFIAVPLEGFAQQQAQAGEGFFKKISQIDKLVDKGKWQEAAKETTALRKLYQKKKWKMQLLGDEGEYEGLDRELDQLAAAVSTKDKSETKIELGAVRSLFKNIYSL
ncbi:MAG TPA: DUF4363 family protein [Bacillales bacterium]|nr:DUF4363 family protein [Bacillales bacterium]